MIKKILLFLLISIELYAYGENLLPKPLMGENTVWIEDFYKLMDKDRNLVIKELNSNDKEKNSLYLSSLLYYWSKKDDNSKINRSFNIASETPSLKDIVEIFINAGINPETQYRDLFMDRNNFTLYQLGIKNNDKDLIKLLLKSDITFRGRDLVQLYKDKNHEYLEFILSNGGDIDTEITSSFGDGGFAHGETTTLLNLATKDGDIDFIKLILKYKPNLNSISVDNTYAGDGETLYKMNSTAIAFLSRPEKTEIYNLLLENGANPPEASLKHIPYGVSYYPEGSRNKQNIEDLNAWRYQNIKIREVDGLLIVEGERLDILSYYNKYIKYNSIEDLKDYINEPDIFEGKISLKCYKILYPNFWNY